MFSIKNSFADCSSCELFGEKSCILETNAESFDQIKVIFVAENPGKDEVEKEVPLIGKTGQLFRKYFSMYKLNSVKYLLTNVVLCQTLDKERKTTINPSDRTIDLCKENCFKIIEQCSNAKLIVLMGGTAGKAFEIFDKDAHITSFRGKMFRWKEHDVFFTVHPSYVSRNRSFEEKFDQDMRYVSAYLGIPGIVSSSMKVEKLEKKGIHFYKIEDKFYTKDYKLLDIQYLHRSNQVLYIFKDKDSKKVFHRENDDYYCYKVPDGVLAKKVMKYDELFQMKVLYREKYGLDHEVTYDGDFKLVTKHSNDYYIQKPEEENLDLNIMFLDIEVYSIKKEFPNIAEAKDPVCMISYGYKDKIVTYVMDNRILLKDTSLQAIKASDEILVFKSEKDLLTTFIKDIKVIDPDVITGWNLSWFDIPYLTNRCEKLGINKDLLSKLGEVNIDGDKGYADIYGFIILDQLTLYRTFTPTKKENYRLGTIAQIELKESKLDSGSNFSQMFRDDVNKAIEYNRRDVLLTVKLEDKVKHISLASELKKICKCTFQSALNAMGQLDSLVSSWLKSKGYASRNANVQLKDEAFAGAYVKEPKVGLHEWIVDFDFTSLYPSIIQTFNVGFNTIVMKLKDHTLGYDLIYQPEKLPEKLSVILDPDLTLQEMEITREQLIEKIIESNLTYTINGCFFKPHRTELSFYSEILEYILQSRKVVKKKMFEAKQAKNKSEEELYEVRQLVFKVLANAMYGVLGNAAYRFYNIDCAISITLSGQEFLKSTIVSSDVFVESLRVKKDIEQTRLNKKEMFGELDRKIEHVITGDTDSVFLSLDSLIKGKNENEKVAEVKVLCDQIRSYLNKDVVEKLVEKHNVSLQYNRLDLKNELVIKRGLFLSKKHYSIYIISEEGTETDEIKSMGLDTKRSDYPSYTKECLKELLDLILKSEKFSMFATKKFIDSKETEFFQRVTGGEKSVARPASFTKDLDDYKRIPQNVIGFLNWNVLEYQIFAHGSKGYLFKINGINDQIAPKEVLERYSKEFLSKNKKLDVICLPDEELSLPNYYNIDIKEMIKFSWVDRYKLMLEPLIGRNENILKF